jgi:putative pyruvate formate lyase activating enzyme
MSAYIELFNTGELAKRVEIAKSILRKCQLCSHKCNVDRTNGEFGQCHTSDIAAISSYGPHFGEEAPLVGTKGSGTIFFTNCNLSCLYCQNYTISQLGEGIYVNKHEIVEIMLSLQAKGCHNINLVSPTHVVPQILEALLVAVESGLYLPLVYNTGGYDSLETLQILDGIVDIYMPDMKYSDDITAERLSQARNYPAVNRIAVKEMYHQVGTLQIDSQGIAKRGLLIRHLVLPYKLSGTRATMNYIAHEISVDSYVNIMAQYRPCYKAYEIQELKRSLLMEEFREALEIAHQEGLKRLNRADIIITKQI